ncbi:hypothetical protein [Deinococcus sp. PEB2-67]
MSDWLNRGRRALEHLPSDAEFASSALSYMVRDVERPEIAQLWNWRTKAGDWDAYRAAMDAWEDANPGQSDTNLRRVCDQLVAEGVLTVRVVRRGWHARKLYRRAAT